jgi:hypothetical protein
VTFALQRTIDGLEARALIATDHDPDLGPPSAVVWVGGVYTIEQGRPERITATVRLSWLLDEAIGARRDGRISPRALIELVAEATGTTTLETAEQLELARQIARRPEPRLNGSSSQRLVDPGTSAR